MDKDVLISLLADSLEEALYELDKLWENAPDTTPDTTEAINRARGAIAIFYENKPLSTVNTITHRIPTVSSPREYIREFERLNGLIPIL